MRLSAYNEGKLFNRVYVLSNQHLRFKQLPGKFIKERISGDKLYKNMTQPLPVRVVGGTLAQAKKMGLLNQPQYNRDPHRTTATRSMRFPQIYFPTRPVNYRTHSKSGRRSF